MPTRHSWLLPSGGGWTSWRLAATLLLAAGCCHGAAFADPLKAPDAAAPRPSAKTVYRIVPLWESGSILPPAINDKDQVSFSVAGSAGAGGRAKFYDGRRVHDVGALGARGVATGAPGADGADAASRVRDVNAQGMAVGVESASGAEIGYVWTRATGLQTFPDLTGGRNASPFAVNARGEVVGATSTGAFSWTREGGLVDLNTRLPHAPPGLTVTRARAVSDKGAIVAESTSGLVLLVPRALADIAPVIGSIKIIGPAAPNHLLGLNAGFTDADLRDTHQASWSWGDGKQGPGIVSARINSGGGIGNVSGQYAWRAPGVYQVRLTVTDSSGKSTTVTRTLAITPDNAGIRP